MCDCWVVHGVACLRHDAELGLRPCEVKVERRPHGADKVHPSVNHHAGDVPYAVHAGKEIIVTKEPIVDAGQDNQTSDSCSSVSQQSPQAGWAQRVAIRGLAEERMGDKALLAGAVGRRGRQLVRYL